MSGREPDEATVERAHTLALEVIAAFPFELKGWRPEDVAARIEPTLRAALAAIRSGAGPIDAVLFCPACGFQHVDAPEGDWTNPPHKTHQCHRCGHLWRPASVPTNGVADVPLGSTDTRPAIRGSGAGRDAVIEEVAHHFAGVPKDDDWWLRDDIVAEIRALASPEKVTTPIPSTDWKCQVTGNHPWAVNQDLCNCGVCRTYRETKATPPAASDLREVTAPEPLCRICGEPWPCTCGSPHREPVQPAASDLRERARTLIRRMRDAGESYEMLASWFAAEFAAIRAEAKAEVIAALREMKSEAFSRYFVNGTSISQAILEEAADRLAANQS